MAIAASAKRNLFKGPHPSVKSFLINISAVKARSLAAFYQAGLTVLNLALDCGTPKMPKIYATAGTEEGGAELGNGACKHQILAGPKAMQFEKLQQAEIIPPDHGAGGIHLQGG